MERHEQIKQQCVQILNYYRVEADPEFTLDTNERIDVVGYFNNKKSPDIGIEIELSSNLQHDASKLARTESLKLKIIVTENYDTASLGSSIKSGDKTIYIVPPPDKDLAFESKIREYTGQNTRKWFNQLEKEIKERATMSGNDPLSNFSDEIRDQGLDLETAKDLIFRAALGGINVGRTDGVTRKGPELPKELLYLAARGIIFENRRGRNYESGKEVIYLLSSDGYELASRIIQERVNEKEESILEISERFGESAILISLIGTRGRFVKDEETFDGPINYNRIFNSF